MESCRGWARLARAAGAREIDGDEMGPVRSPRPAGTTKADAMGAAAQAAAIATSDE